MHTLRILTFMHYAYYTDLHIHTTDYTQHPNADPWHALIPRTKCKDLTPTAGAAALLKPGREGHQLVDDDDGEYVKESF